jgi:hypothetical protein
MGKDANKPRGKTTAYAFFVQQCREELKKKNPNETVVFSEFAKKCGEKWKVYNCATANSRSKLSHYASLLETSVELSNHALFQQFDVCVVFTCLQGYKFLWWG